METGANITFRIPVWLDKFVTFPLLTYRLLRYGWPFRKIQLGQGKYTIVEPPDYYRLQHYKWWLHSNGSNLYAARTEITDNLKSRIIFMQRDIMQPTDELEVDHRNCDSLDNRRDNLRIVTHAQNMRNRRKRKNTSSRYIGVSFHKKRKHWTANIRRNGKKIWLGSFKNEIDAARAYDAAVKKYNIKYARINFPGEN